VTFEVDDLQAILDGLAADGYHLVGGVGQYKGIWQYGLFAVVGHIRAAASRSGLTVRQACQELAGRPGHPAQ